MSRTADCFPWTVVEWLECRLSKPGRAGPAEALGLAGMADGMAAGVGWDVEALGMAAAAAMGGLAHCRSCRSCGYSR